MNSQICALAHPQDSFLTGVSQRLRDSCNLQWFPASFHAWPGELSAVIWRVCAFL